MTPAKHAPPPSPARGWSGRSTVRATRKLGTMLLGMLLLTLLGAPPGPAHAEPFATVAVIEAQDAGGRWKKVDTSPDAVWVDGDTERPLTQGMALPVGAVIKTGLVRVRIEIGAKNRVDIEEGAEIALQDWGVLQTLGDAYYRVRGAFTVEYGTVEATVEGTVFDVHGPDPTWVAVRKGKVRVKTDAGDEILLKRGERVVVDEDGGLTEAEVWKRCPDCGLYHER